MVVNFIRERVRSFRAWWSRPPTLRDKVGGASVGAIGFLLIDVILGAIFDPSASIGIWGIWAVASAAIGAAFGMRFPKVAICVFFPFLLIG